MSQLLRDLRFGARALLKRPVFTLVAALTLALGIGANTAIFSVVQGVLLDTIPFDEPARLVYLGERSESFGSMSVAYPNFLDWRERNRVFEGLAAHRYESFTLTGGGRPEQLAAVQASAGMFSMLAVQPQAGRFWTTAEDEPGTANVVVLGHGLWQRRFGGMEDVVGQSIQLDGESYEVIGILPEGFLYPLWERGIDLWLPIGHFAKEWIETRGNHPGIRVTARLAPGIDHDTARKDMERISAELAAEYPDTNTGAEAEYSVLQDRMVRNLKPALLVLSGAVALVLLIACVNVANLLLARGASRGQEMAVRSALGASGWQMTRQLLAESVLLAMVGGVLGLAVAQAGLKGLLAIMNPETLPVFGEISIDARVLGFTFIVAVLTGLLFGLAPALQALRENFVGALKDGSKGSDGAGRQRLRGALVVAESALALLLLIGAVLFLRSFAELMKADPGFESEGVLAFQISLPESAYPEDAEQASFFVQLAERLAGLPGVESAAHTLPLLGGWQNTFIVEGQEPPPPGERQHTEVMRVSPDYFETLDIRLLSGRLFDRSDRADSLPVAVVDQRFAETLWPGEDALGKRVKFGTDLDDDNEWMEVIGVVNHVKSYGVQNDSRIQLYRPSVQGQLPFATFLLKTSGAPRNLAGPAEEAVLALDPAQPIDDVMTMAEWVALDTVAEGLAASLLGAFAVLALTLAAIGIYGVIAYSVAERQREIGIRMALGAARGDVLRLVVGQGLRLVTAGIAVGLGIAILVAPILESQLYLVDPRDPATFLVLPLVLALVALLASALPARRASRVAPVVALHHE